MTSKSLDSLMQLSAPAELHVGSEIESKCWPVALSLLRVWRESSGGRTAPKRNALFPADISNALPLVTIFDVERDPFLLRCRLMGTAFSDAIGFDATGDVAGRLPMSKPIIDRAKWIVDNVQPILMTALPLVWSPDKNYKTYDSLCLPFLGDAGEVDSIWYLNQFHIP